MAQIREIRRRIKSIQSTQKVTHAMELVAAAKMRKSQFAALASRTYSTNLTEILEVIRVHPNASHPLLSKNESAARYIILIGSDRGLAGGLNINLFREILRSEVKDATYITVGKKATGFAAKTNSPILASFQSEEKAPLDLARTLTKITIEGFLKGEVGEVSLLYPHFEATIKQTPKWVRLLPIELALEETNGKGSNGNLLFEPTADEILEAILPHYVLTSIYQILLETKASEHSARMVAMKNATDAAGDLIDDLTLAFNQARQEAITKELLDIVTAQSALE
ncbi:ATP synthase F1 subunit gamma [Candidatus Curtissbacteria bacterium RIFCSPLOWO2_02_FULL_42_37]|uniref:ATP synthase gamma chain n=1 Tax=Candidatus Curtissbacteria bacterium RIFCSPLOWO2_01_FULL_42_50 TaxID=1797730 RepID=A0A1F5H2U5_9BACT|nr:MAG: ATP synthase F1 subunit gamma [Candidatus Curtissbacteria bacterium RIFCSPHIGHO2_02_FULL_42_58]OGD97255.1 MAG: ATP synthase F1 subunit gamma [Candidatus Curtissbacteria bacterium RIFCSPHIGHO2_12_FULL_42_33]OGD98421.1 MAG: ATP synthase F1 subunit gamma [Candidatus Curtissbacteria bacterium RIFCSPLOWO2_01_FULL_42_50]OGE11613.1 MAG: ATP synthase F1 subunit gamma [Candidatus Curtissbacteria bacterium RIFCSPLOWO2_02_FULL_42_37]